MNRIKPVLVGGLAVLALAGCGQAEPPAPAPVSSSSSSSSATAGGPTYSTPESMAAKVTSIKLQGCSQPVVNFAGATTVSCSTPADETVYFGTAETPGILSRAEQLSQGAGSTFKAGRGWYVTGQKPSTAETLYRDLAS